MSIWKTLKDNPWSVGIGTGLVVPFLLWLFGIVDYNKYYLNALEKLHALDIWSRTPKTVNNGSFWMCLGAMVFVFLNTMKSLMYSFTDKYKKRKKVIAILKFTEANYKGAKYQWEWKLENKQPVIKNWQAVCPYENTPLVFKKCPYCAKQYHVLSEQEVKALISQSINEKDFWFNAFYPEKDKIFFVK